MISNLTTTLVLFTLASPAQGFGGFLTSVIKEGFKKSINDAFKEKLEPKMFEDVHLPYDMSFKDRIKNQAQLSIQANIDVVKYGSGRTGPDTILRERITGTIKPDANAPRSEAWRACHTAMLNDVIKVNPNDPDPCEGYLYFGNRDYTKILPMLCQVNPFWASGLTVDGNYIELNAYDPDSKSKYSRICSYFQDPSRKLNVRFNKDMTINAITDYSSGKPVSVPRNEWNEYATSVCFNVAAYVSTIHALIHVLHYLMTAAIVHSTRHDDTLAAWANPYDDNIAIKYVEVALLLYESNLGDNDNKLLTGKNGFGFTPEVMGPIREILCDWGSFKTEEDYTKKFLLKDIYDTAKDPEEVIKSANILTEFKKHMDNVSPFADELTAAMKKHNERAVKDCEESLKDFMAGCGKGVSSIDSISSWLQLMSCTGLTHGSTLSYTRLVLMPEVMRWRTSDEKFDEIDVEIMSSAGGTIEGMTLDRHVFTSEINHGWKWNTSSMAEDVKKVLEKWDAKAEQMKADYQAELLKNPDLREYGWILTDHCADGYDGKQHTLTTYI